MYLSTIISSLFSRTQRFFPIFIPPSFLSYFLSTFFQIELNLNPTWENLWKRNPNPNDSTERRRMNLCTRIKRTKLRQLIILPQFNRVASQNHYSMYISLPLNELEVKKRLLEFFFLFFLFLCRKTSLTTRHTVQGSMMMIYVIKRMETPNEETNGCKCCTFNFIFGSTFFRWSCGSSLANQN